MNALQLANAAFDLPEDVVSNAEGNQLNFRVGVENFVEQAALNHFDATGEMPTERVMTEARRLLTEKVGPERAQHILTPRLHNTLVYPNVSIMGLNIHVRVIKPVAVDRTEITVYPVRLLGAPDAMNFANIRLLNVTHAAASFVQTDDLEAFARAQKGLRSTATDWVDISRGLGAEEPDRELNATRELATHEMVVRAQYKAWAGYMREAI